MSILRSQKLLLIVPHFKVFIRDQATLIRSYFDSMTVLMPIPYFSSLVLKLPYIKRYFRFLKLAVESRNELAQDYTVVSPKFFTLPIEALRKRNCYLATQKCIEVLSKSHRLQLNTRAFFRKRIHRNTLKGLSGKPFVVTGHSGDVYDLLKEFHRVLKLSSIFIMQVPNIAWILYRVQLLFGKLPNRWSLLRCGLGTLTQLR